jgi:uncharacterized protein YndB with AHSA1/START domain
MTVISTHKDIGALTLTCVAEFDAPPERVWHVWQEPRMLEQWWGPPGWPATFESHDFSVGGRSSYFMSGPKGEKERGWWEITAINSPRRIEFLDGFADESGDPVSTMEPTRTTVTFEKTGGGTRMTIVSKFASAEDMEKMLDMGMEEGLREAVGQIDGLVVR